MREGGTAPFFGPLLKSGSFVLVTLLALVLAGCGGRRTPPVAGPPPGPSTPPAPTTPSTAPAPSLEVRVEPQNISAGESAFLIWEAENADSVLIDQGIGEVEKSGRLRVFPTETSTYRIVAAGPGGNAEKVVTLEVGRAPADILEEELAGKTPAEKFAYLVKPVFFAYDSAELSEEAKLTLDGNIRWLTSPENQNWTIVIEGHTDERGTAEYNLALGDKRAQVVRAYLAAHGVDPSRLITISLGEERPFDPRPVEEAYALNRRAHFVLLQEQARQP